jgi:hypothetical protein
VVECHCLSVGQPLKQAVGVVQPKHSVELVEIIEPRLEWENWRIAREDEPCGRVHRVQGQGDTGPQEPPGELVGEENDGELRASVGSGPHGSHAGVFVDVV